MRLTNEIRQAIKSACQAEKGGGAAFAKRAGFTPAQISRYHSGKIASIADESWERLFPNIASFLPPEYLSHLDIASKWKIAPTHPVLREHLEQAGKAAQEYTDKFTRDLMQFGMDLGLDIYDQLTIDLLKYWRDMTPARRYLLLSYAARLTEEELPPVEAEPAKKVAGSQVS